MDFSEVIRAQIERDRRRGFDVDFETDREKTDQLMRDLVGLVSEVGEFSDTLKKVGLAQTNKAYKGPSLSDATPQLRSELADIAIYIFRLSTILSGNLEQDILEKININDERYRSLEQ